MAIRFTVQQRGGPNLLGAPKTAKKNESFMGKSLSHRLFGGLSTPQWCGSGPPFFLAQRAFFYQSNPASGY